jgi:hypothetical protein
MHGFLDIFTGMLIGIIVQVGISNLYDYLVFFLENSTALQGNDTILKYSSFSIIIIGFFSDLFSAKAIILLPLLH